MTTVSSLADFFAKKVASGFGDWKVQVDPRGLININPHTRVIDIVVDKDFLCDTTHRVIFLATRY